MEFTYFFLLEISILKCLSVWMFVCVSYFILIGHMGTDVTCCLKTTVVPVTHRQPVLPSFCGSSKQCFQNCVEYLSPWHASKFHGKCCRSALSSVTQSQSHSVCFAERTQKLVAKSHWLSICVHFNPLSNREQTYNDEAESIARLRRFLLPVEEWGHSGAAFRAVIL